MNARTTHRVRRHHEGGASVAATAWTVSTFRSSAAVLRRSTTAHATQATMKTT